MFLVAATGPSGKIVAEAARAALLAGATGLDAVEIGLRAAEADESLTDIGYGGLPDASGRLSLDAALFHGPGHRAGAVAALTGCRHPISVARRVMEKTPHVFLVGDGARRFATSEGFPDEGALLTEHSAQRYDAFLRGEIQPERTGERPPGSVEGSEYGAAASETALLYGAEEHPNSPDTVGVIVRDDNGDLFAGTSTSGLGFKVPGRVGDSPIVGSGLYVENETGAAVCLGMGEQMMQVCLAFRVVAALESGLSAQGACAGGIRALRSKRPYVRPLSCLVIAVTKVGELGLACGGVHPAFHAYLATPSGVTRHDAPVIDAPVIDAPVIAEH